MTLLYAFIGLFALSTCLTGLFRSYALKKQLLDLPNHRSSHTVPTPRGGGVVFVVLFLLTLPLAYTLKILPGDLFKALLLPAVIIAVVTTAVIIAVTVIAKQGLAATIVFP